MITTSDFRIELDNQIRSNRSLIYITTFEEQRVDDIIQEICRKSNPWSFVFWDISYGAVTNSSGIQPDKNMDQAEILNWFDSIKIEQNDFCILVLHDFYKFLAPDGHPGQMEITTIRALRNLVENCNNQRKCVIITGAKYFLPTEFEKISLFIDLPLPDKGLISEKVLSLMDKTQKKSELSKKFKTNYNAIEIENIVKAFQGLSLREIELICTYFILTDNFLDPKKIASKKQSIIKQTGILEWIDVDYGLSEVGGLENLKNWLIKRKEAFSEKATLYGLPSNPKGLLIAGIQGTGKTRISKSIASYWNLPLLRLDVGRIFSGIVGSSEENLRSVIKTAESVAPCIIWVDEIDKAFSNTSFSSDSGTSSRILGTFLTWMQEHTSAVFVVATANDVQKLPPELIRKGRFDDIFFVDLPDAKERTQIWKIHLEKRNFDYSVFNINDLVYKSDGFTGAEIEAALIAAMYEGFSDNMRKIQTEDIIKELSNSVPLSVTMKEEINLLRTWAKKRARSASNSEGLNFVINNELDETL